MPFPKILAGALLLAAGCFVGCDVLQPSLRNVDNYQKRVSYHRGACFGQCPVYTLDLYDNGLLVYTGERFTDRQGTWQRTIDRRRAQSLLDSFQRAGFENFPRSFRSQSAGASVIDLAYTDVNGRTYATSYTDYVPEELLELDRKLRALAEMEGYRFHADTLPASRSPYYRNGTGIPDKPAQIIVQLAAGVNPDAWVVKYADQDARVVERVAPTSPYWVIEANAARMPTADLIEIMRADAEVLSAQVNNRVLPR